jgi:hypothetical protein
MCGAQVAIRSVCCAQPRPGRTGAPVMPARRDRLRISQQPISKRAAGRREKAVSGSPGAASAPAGENKPRAIQFLAANTAVGH